MKRLRSDEAGQAIVEYILIFAVAVSVIGLFARGFRGTLARTWKQWNDEIAAPCPGCAPPKPADREN